MTMIPLLRKRAPKSETSTDDKRTKLESAINLLLVRGKFETREDAIEFLRTDQPELFEKPKAAQMKSTVYLTSKNFYSMLAKKCVADYELRKVKKQDEPKPTPATPEELATAINDVITSGKASTKADALGVLRRSRPEMFGEKPITSEDIINETKQEEDENMEELALHAKLKKAVQARYQCDNRAADAYVRDGLANGTMLKYLGREGVAHLASIEGGESVLKQVADVRKSNPGVSRVDALRTLRKQAQSGSDFENTVAKYRADGMSGMAAMRRARREAA